MIPSGFRVERLKVDRGGEFISREFQDYCLQTGVSLEYASTNTRQQIGMSERVGTLAAMVRCMLDDSGLLKFLWGELMFMAAFLGDRAPHSAIGMHVSVQNAKRDRAGPETSSSHPCPGLHAY